MGFSPPLPWGGGRKAFDRKADHREGAHPNRRLISFAAALLIYACSDATSRGVSCDWAAGRVMVNWAPRPGPSLSAMISPW